MNPIFTAAVIAGARSASNNRTVSNYAPKIKPKEIGWQVGEDRVDSLKIASFKVARHEMDLPKGIKKEATQLEIQKVNPRANHFKRSNVLALLGLFAAASPIAGAPLLVAGALAGFSVAAGIAERFKGKNAPTEAEKTKVIRKGDVWVEKDAKEKRDKMVYLEKFGPNGPVKETKNPTFIGWVE